MVYSQLSKIQLKAIIETTGTFLSISGILKPSTMSLASSLENKFDPDVINDRNQSHFSVSKKMVLVFQ